MSILHDRDKKLTDDPDDPDDSDDSDNSDDSFDFDLIRRLASDPGLLFPERKYSWNDAGLIDCRPSAQDLAHAQGADVLVLDTSTINAALDTSPINAALDTSAINTASRRSKLLPLFEKGVPLATTISVLEELAVQSDRLLFHDAVQQKNQKNIFLAIAATGLLFDFEGYQDTPEYLLLQDLRDCSSKTYATNFIRDHLERWDILLANVIKGHPLYERLFGQEGVSYNAKEKMFHDIMEALFKNKHIPVSPLRYFDGAERPAVAIGSMTSSMNYRKSLIVRKTTQVLDEVINKNPDFVLDHPSTQVIRSYGDNHWYWGCKKYIRHIIGGRINRIIDREIRGGELEPYDIKPYDIKNTSADADTEILLLSYLFANRTSSGSISFVGDGGKLMPSFDQEISGQIREGFPFYLDFFPVSRPVRIGLVSGDTWYKEALHLLRYVRKR